MGKSMVSKRSKGKVDFKRKEDPQDPDKKAVENNDEEEKIVFIMKKCKITRDEVILAKLKFLRRRPDGQLTREEFLDEAKDQLLAQAVFKVYDRDESGTMDFTEYMQAHQALSLNTIDEKLEWIFSVFDSDNGGTIEMEEIEQIVGNIFDFAGIRKNKSMLNACVMDVKRSVDKDNDGSITKEEFIQNARCTICLMRCRLYMEFFRRSKFIRNMFLTD